MSKDIAKMISEYVHFEDDLKQLYSSIRRRKLILTPIQKFDQIIKTKMFNDLTSYTFNPNSYQKIGAEIVKLLTAEHKQYTIPIENNGKRTMLYVTIEDTETKIIIDHVRKLGMKLKGTNKYYDVSIEVSWDHWK